jgi:hypothetical protein
MPNGPVQRPAACALARGHAGLVQELWPPRPRVSTLSTPDRCSGVLGVTLLSPKEPADPESSEIKGDAEGRRFFATGSTRLDCVV